MGQRWLSVSVLGVMLVVLGTTYFGRWEIANRDSRGTTIICFGIMTDPLLKSDQIHPNDPGYEKIAQRIAQVVEPLLR